MIQITIHSFILNIFKLNKMNLNKEVVKNGPKYF